MFVKSDVELERQRRVEANEWRSSARWRPGSDWDVVVIVDEDWGPYQKGDVIYNGIAIREVESLPEVQSSGTANGTVIRRVDAI
jgi:predicted nucleotidyltransferase